MSATAASALSHTFEPPAGASADLQWLECEKGLMPEVKLPSFVPGVVLIDLAVLAAPLKPLKALKPRAATSRSCNCREHPATTGAACPTARAAPAILSLFRAWPAACPAWAVQKNRVATAIKRPQLFSRCSLQGSNAPTAFCSPIGPRRRCHTDADAVLVLPPHMGAKTTSQRGGVRIPARIPDLHPAKLPRSRVASRNWGWSSNGPRGATCKTRLASLVRHSLPEAR